MTRLLCILLTFGLMSPTLEVIVVELGIVDQHMSLTVSIDENEEAEKEEETKSKEEYSDSHLHRLAILSNVNFPISKDQKSGLSVVSEVDPPPPEA